ncbi:MAG: Ribonuclease toxin, BrnT, of type toxin-antitoxin system [Blastocatellia bacterium]|nr:Ribonuclease toxin, BrnT, of type toxin-antitoxin system [Blastocatellia bacterium]
MTMGTRFLTFGLLWGEVVAIVHIETDKVIRVISVRRASKDEEETYFTELRN